MRYEDASGAFQASGPIANDDSDTLSAGQRGPATGNLITGEGTQYGASGADSASGGHITAIAGKGGEDSSFSGGKLSIDGEHGRLTVDADGNYSYMANANVENVRDRFTYTLADNAGNSDTAALIVEIGKTPAVIKANAQQIVVGPDGVVTLPPGVQLSDVHVVGRNLVIDMPDGSQMIIVDGAIFVPQLSLDGVEVPATNVAALLIGQEVQPAAGEIPPSGGGNFALPPPPLDPGIPLGDLIPPTEYNYVPPQPEEVLDIENEEPEIFIQPDGQPAAVAAVDQVEEAGLPTRNGGEPAGSAESADGNGADNDVNSETTTGNIIYDSPDGVDSITLNGVEIVSVGQVIAGTYGDLTITSIAPGVIGYSYTLDDNTSGNDTQDDFAVTLTDLDGDTATATLTIDIIDDVPTARPDTDSIAAGQYGPVTGNVITDASAGDAGDSDNGADTVGADNASVTAVSSVNVPANSDGTSPFVVNGQYGVLTLQSDGSYSYVRNPGTPGGVNDVFNYTLTDGDGDTSQTTLTISIGDATPETRPNPLAQLDDDALAGGIPGGTGDDVDAANLSGTLLGVGGDGPLTFDLLLTGAPAGFSYVDGPNGAVHVMQGSTHVLTITINASTGAYTVSQVNPIDHVAGNDENNAQFTINYQVTDQDGDSATGTLNIDVDDDSPEMNRADVSLPSLTVDETNLAANASGDYSVVFAGAYGADGPGTTSYAVTTVNGTNSGLVDVATGLPVLLYNIGGVVTGSTAATVDGVTAGNTVFTVSVNSATGVVTLDQVRAVSHPDASNPDDPVSPAATSIQLVASITDGDGDSDSLAVNIGASLSLEDDGPSVTPTGVEPTLLVDESDLTVNNTQNFGDAFNEVFGADGPAASGSVSYALGINAGSTGLIDTATGEAVVLVLNGGVVEGRTAGTNDLVFTISVNAAGDVTVDQLRAVVHPDPANHDEPISLAEDNLITLTATATDKDGDTASASIGIGKNVVLEDDGPDVAAVLTGNLLKVDETDGVGVAGEVDAPGGNLGATTVAAASLFTVSNPHLSADSPTTLGYALTLSSQGVASGLQLSTTNAPIFLYNIGGVITGSTSATEAGVNAGNTAFAVSINPGTGAVTLTQFLAVEHSDPTNHDEDSSALTSGVLGVTITATDGDGDKDSASVDLGSVIRFEDDGPSIDVSVNGQVTEPVLVTQDAETDGNPTSQDSASSAINFGGVFGLSSSGGSDGAASAPALSYSLGISAPGVNSGLTSAGAPIFLHLIGGVVVGSTSASAAGVNAGNTVFNVSVSGTGVVTLTQFAQIDHTSVDPSPTGSPFADHVASLADGMVTLTASSTITDNDGDTANDSATVNIGANLRFEDDGPDAQNEPQQNVPEGNQTVSGTFDFVSGADSPATVTHINGIALVFGGDGWSQWIAVDDGQIRAQADGDYQFQTDANGSGITSGTFTVTDFDGDTDTANWSFNVTDANLPTAGVSAARLDDDGLTGGNPLSTTGDIDANVGEIAVVNPEEDIFHGQLTLNFGGDGPGTVTFAAMHNTTGSVGTETVRYTWAGSTLTATVEGGPRNGTVLFDIVVNQTTGEYTLTLRDNVIHTAGGDEASALNVALTYTVTDSDNTPAGGVNGTLNITFNDDAPTLDVTKGADAGVTLTTDDLDSIGGLTDSASTSANFGGVFGLTQAAGADGATAATLSYALDVAGFSGAGVDSGLDQGGATIFLYEIGGKVVGSTSATLAGVTAGNTVFDVAVSGTGVVTLTQYSQIDHPIAGDPSATGSPFADHIISLSDSLVTLTASSTITDGDGDTASDSEVVAIGANLRFTDDGPDVSATLTGTLLKLDETDGVGVLGETDPVGGNLGTITVAAATLVTISNPHVSADAPTTNSYSLVLSADGAASGLLVSSNNAPIFLYNIGGVITGSTSATLAGVNAGNTAFTVSVNSGTGAVTMTQFLAVEHGTPGASHDEDSSAINAGVLNLRVTATDFDGDTDFAQVDLGSVIRFEDDGPRFGTVDSTLQILNDADPSNTGDLQIIVGSDSPVASNNVISVANFNVAVNGVDLDPSDFTLTPGSEDATFANYTFSFTYDTGSGGEATANGTLVFNKVAGTYTVDLDGPIQGFSILQTATGTLFQGYEFGTSTPDGSQPAISVTQIQGTPGDPQPDDLFVQFTSVSEPSSGTGDNNLEFASWVPGANNPPPVNSGGDTSFNAGDLFNQADGWVSTSNTANGVDGDTIQGSEVLDFVLVQGANPTGVLAQPATYGQAESMFLKFDGIGAAEDMIVVLKLYDAGTNTYTTRAIMVQNADIQKGPGTGPGDYSGITLDNNDGLVIIESNDYNGPGENWVIVGAQIAGSDQGLTGSAINLNSAIGDAGGSNTTGSFQAFSTDTHDGPFKISSIGFVAQSTTEQDATIDFDVTITDADGDTATQHITVEIGDTQSALAAQSSFSTQSSSKMAANDDFSALLAGDSFQKSYGGNSFGNVGTTGITSAMVAASGLGMMSNSLQGFNDLSSSHMVQNDFQSLSIQTVGREGLDMSIGEMSFGSQLGGSTLNTAQLSSSGFSFDDNGFGGGSLDSVSFGSATPAYVPHYASGEPMIANIPAFAANVPTVSMASAEMLQAAGVVGNVQHGGAVEQIVAEALGSHAPTIDAILANLPGGIAEFSAISHMASPDAAGVPAWDMGMQGGFAPMHDMIMKVAAVAVHHDAVQPA